MRIGFSWTYIRDWILNLITSLIAWKAWLGICAMWMLINSFEREDIDRGATWKREITTLSILYFKVSPVRVQLLVNEPKNVDTIYLHCAGKTPVPPPLENSYEHVSQSWQLNKIYEWYHWILQCYMHKSKAGICTSIRGCNTSSWSSM